MSARHTPGPWSACNKFSGVTLSNWRVSEGDSTPGVEAGIAIMSGGRSDETEQANARLIAAAPELLESLQSLEKRLTAAANAFYATGTRKALMEALGGWKDDITPARAAIAKATAE